MKMNLSSKLWFADFETNSYRVHSTKTNVSIWCLKSETNEEFFGAGIKSFLEKVKELPAHSKIYFHNLDWDATFIIYELFEQGFELKNAVQKPNHFNNVLQFFYQNGRIYNLEVWFSKRQKISFYCSYLLTNLSLYKIGVALGYKKLDAKKWIQYWGFIDCKFDLKEAIRNRLKKYNDKFKYFQSFEEFEQLNAKHHFKTGDCECFKCYLERDVDILKKFLVHLFKEKKLSLGLTGAATALKTYQKWARTNLKWLDKLRLFGSWSKNRSDYLQPIRPKTAELFYNSYAGGIVINNPWIFTESNDIKNIDGASYDVNSLFPSVMTRPVVLGELFDKPVPYENNTKLLTVKIKSLKLRPGEIPIFPRKYFPPGSIKEEINYLNKRNVYELNLTKEFYCLVWEEEFKYFLRAYKIDYTIENVYYAVRKNVFKDFILAIGKNKEEATNESTRYYWKIILNSLYGKFGQRISRNSSIWIDVKKPFDFKDLRNLSKGLELKIAQGTEKKFNNLFAKWKEGPEAYKKYVSTRKDFSFFDRAKTIVKLTFAQELTEDYKGKTFSVGTASYITSQARIELYKAIFEHKKDFLYSDTDSIMLKSTKFNLPISNTTIGHWKPEKRYNRIKVIESKKYLIEQTHSWDKINNQWIENPQRLMVCAGIRQDPSKATPKFEDFNKGAEARDIQLQKKQVAGGLLLVPVIKKY